MSNSSSSRLSQDSTIHDSEESVFLEAGTSPGKQQHIIHTRIPSKTNLIIFASLLLNIIAMLSIYLNSHSHGHKEFESTLPVVTQFLPNSSFMSLDHKYDKLWNDQVSYPMGIYSSQGVESGEEKFGLVTMFHQLHCLQGMRAAIQKAREGRDPGVDQNDDKHWPHCFDYLRQTVLCHADDVVERHNVKEDGTVSQVISGYQEFRKCNNAQLLYEAKDKFHKTLPQNNL